VLTHIPLSRSGIQITLLGAAQTALPIGHDQRQIGGYVRARRGPALVTIRD
jgi:hypothetical protein